MLFEITLTESYDTAKQSNDVAGTGLITYVFFSTKTGLNHFCFQDKMFGWRIENPEITEDIPGTLPAVA